MIYAYDKSVGIPMIDLYDTQSALAAIGAAKDMYEKGLQEIKDFRKDYGDLMFLNEAYLNWYNNNFNVGGFISDLYKQGIDPVRSAEGRILVNQYINSRKYGELAQRRLWDANMRDYNASKAKLGTAYDPEFEEFLLGGDPNNWGDKAFTATSATPYVSLRDMVHPTFAAIKPHLLTSAEAKEKLKEDYDPRNNYYGVTEGDMRNALGSYLPGIRNSANYEYQLYKAKQDLEAEGLPTTRAAAEQRLIENAIISDYGITTPLESKADEWKMAEYDRATKYLTSGANNPVPPEYDGYSSEDDLYESALKNMVGIDPQYKFGKDKYGMPITAQKLFNNNPEFYQTYRNILKNIVDEELRTDKKKSTGNKTNIVSTLTHQYGESLKFLPTMMGEKELTKWGDNDLTGRGFYPLGQSSSKRLITRQELERQLRVGAGLPAMPNPEKPNKELEKAIKSNNAIYRANTNPLVGLVSGFVDNRIKMWLPIVISYKGSKDPIYRYKEIDYRSVPSTGDSKIFNETGISTVYDGKYSFASKIASSKTDKALGVGQNEINSVSIDSPY